jgi:hypothetical protein
MGRGLDGYFFDTRSLAGCAVLKAREARSAAPAGRSRQVSGGYGVGETPLPIPNRAVKPHSADGTWPARAWESRSPPVLSSRAAREAARRRYVCEFHPGMTGTITVDQ